MADINPLTSGATYTRQRDRFLMDGLPFGSGTPIANARTARLQGFRLYTYGYDQAPNGATSDFARHRGVLGVAWQSNEIADNAGAILPLGGQVRMSSSGVGAGNGWVHLLTRGTFQPTVTTAFAGIAAKGDPDWCPPGVIFANQRAAAPVTRDSRRVYTAHLKMQFYGFTQSGGASDRWRCTTGTRGTDTLCAGIVAVAWQCENPVSVNSDRVAATIDASGDIIFTPQVGGASTGVLWVWKRG